MKKIFLALLIFILYSVSACQNNQTPRSTPISIRPDPTSTPTPAAPAKPPTPTSIISDLVATQPYTHTTQRFQIDYPANWQLSEQADGVIFIEPGDQAGYGIFFDDVGELFSTEQLGQYLTLFITENFVEEEANFKTIQPVKERDDMITTQFATLDPNLGQTINEARILQSDTLILVLFISTTEKQWEISQEKLQSLADTLTPLDTSPTAEIEATEEPPVWLLAGPQSSRFAFFYPSDWEISQEKNRVVTTMPETNISFEASTFSWPNADDPKAAEKAAKAYITNLTKKSEQVDDLPPAEFPLYTMTGATIDFLYTTKKGESMAGSVITAAEDGQMYRVVFVAPAELYQGALEWFNPMYKSFQTLSAEDIIQPE